MNHATINKFNDGDRIEVPKVLKDPLKKPPFDFDCLTQIEGIDPLIKLFDDFDWQAVTARIDGLDSASNRDLSMLAQAVGEILRWIVSGYNENHVGQRNVSRIGARAVALAFVVNPGVFDAATLERLAEAVGCSARHLKRHCRDARDTFGIRNRCQHSD